jgi:hypothetical protein
MFIFGGFRNWTPIILNTLAQIHAALSMIGKVFEHFTLVSRTASKFDSISRTIHVVWTRLISMDFDNENFVLI